MHHTSIKIKVFYKILWARRNVFIEVYLFLMEGMGNWRDVSYFMNSSLNSQLKEYFD